MSSGNEKCFGLLFSLKILSGDKSKNNRLNKINNLIGERML